MTLLRIYWTGYVDAQLKEVKIIDNPVLGCLTRLRIMTQLRPRITLNRWNWAFRLYVLFL